MLRLRHRYLFGPVTESPRRDLTAGEIVAARTRVVGLLLDSVDKDASGVSAPQRSERFDYNGRGTARSEGNVVGGHVELQAFIRLLQAWTCNALQKDCDVLPHFVSVRSHLLAYLCGRGGHTRKEQS